MSVHGSGLSGPDQPLQLCTAVVLGLGCQLLDVDIMGKQVEASHLVGVDGQDLDTPLLIWQTWRSDDDACEQPEEEAVKGEEGCGHGKSKKYVLWG